MSSVSSYIRVDIYTFELQEILFTFEQIDEWEKKIHEAEKLIGEVYLNMNKFLKNKTQEKEKNISQEFFEVLKESCKTPCEDINIQILEDTILREALKNREIVTEKIEGRNPYNE